MLKVLRIASLVVLILSSFATIAIIAFGLKENPEMRAFLQKPGIFERMSGVVSSIDSQKNILSPLVVQARAFALRIDPPVPKDNKTLIRKPTDKEEKIDRGGKGRGLTKRIEVPTTPSFKFDLLATVRYVSIPEKSLALFQSDGRQEWFYRDQTIGHHTIKEIKDGRVILTQPGQGLLEVPVPLKPDGRELLKGSQTP